MAGTTLSYNWEAQAAPIHVMRITDYFYTLGACLCRVRVPTSWIPHQQPNFSFFPAGDDPADAIELTGGPSPAPSLICCSALSAALPALMRLSSRDSVDKTMRLLDLASNCEISFATVIRRSSMKPGFALI